MIEKPEETCGKTKTICPAPDLRGHLLWDARRLARARAGASLEVRVVEHRAAPGTVVGQSPEPGGPLEGDVVRVDVAQPSWVRLLPGIFQDADEDTGGFLCRFLAIQQHLQLLVDEQVETVHRLFDPRETPEAFLPWLASWGALRLREGWSDARRREAVARAAELHALRGTAAGIVLALRLFADVEAEIEEPAWPFPGFVVGRSSVIGRTALTRPALRSQCFVVKVPEPGLPDEKLRALHSVLESEKPAHAHFAVAFRPLEETSPDMFFWRPGVAGRIGVDARVPGHTDAPAEPTQPAA